MIFEHVGANRSGMSLVLPYKTLRAFCRCVFEWEKKDNGEWILVEIHAENCIIHDPAVGGGKK